MDWIEIHDGIDCSKLNRSARTVGCSKAEMVGILVYVWLYAAENADVDGKFEDVNEDDIADVIKANVGKGVGGKRVVNVLMRDGWLEKDESDNIRVHDWHKWQKQEMQYEHGKEAARMKMQRKRAAAKAKENEADAEATPEKKKTVKKQNAEAKIQFAENVKMLKKEYEKLCIDYGKEFTDKLIYELDNYKGANGKKYKSDYRAILNWVVDRCKEKYPELAKAKNVNTSENLSPDEWW